MSDISTSSTFSGVTKIKTTDRVLGGDLGVINIQAQQLANRDKYLLDALLAMSEPYYTVKVSTNNKLTLPSEFSSPNYQFSIQSRGTWMEPQTNHHMYVNSYMLEMRVNARLSTTVNMLCNYVDDAVYVYLDGVLIPNGSQASLFNNATPKVFAINMTTGGHLIQIVKNNNGGGASYVSLHGDIIGPTVTFVRPYTLDF